MAAMSSMLPATEACLLPMRERCKLSMRVAATAPSAQKQRHRLLGTSHYLAHNAYDSRLAAFASATVTHTQCLVARSRRCRAALPALRSVVLCCSGSRR